MAKYLQTQKMTPMTRSISYEIVLTHSGFMKLHTNQIITKIEMLIFYVTSHMGFCRYFIRSDLVNICISMSGWVVRVEIFHYTHNNNNTEDHYSHIDTTLNLPIQLWGGRGSTHCTSSFSLYWHCHFLSVFCHYCTSLYHPEIQPDQNSLDFCQGQKT